MKRTNRQLYKYTNDKADESNRPYMKPALFNTLYEAARLGWMKLKHKDYETHESVRRDLAPFDRHYLFGDTRTVRLSDLPIANEHRFLTGVHADFTLSCNGSDLTYTLPVVPIAKDKAFALLTDPFGQPDDTEPCYIESSDNGGEFLKILSTNVPKAVTVHYLKYPAAMDVINNPDGLTEEGEAQQLEIVAMLLEAYFADIENFNSSQKKREEIINSGI